MKTIYVLMVAAIVCFSMRSSAQVAMTPAIDTLTNTDTARIVAQVKGSNNVLTVQATYVKISGTPSTSILLQGSVDGVNYVTIEGADTALITNVATPQSFVWVQPRSNFLWYRLYAVTAGTQSGQLKSYILYRP